MNRALYWTLASIAVVLLLAALLASGYLLYLNRKIGAVDRPFNELRIGQPFTPPDGFAEYPRPLFPSLYTTDITKTYRLTISTWYLPITWEIIVDSSDRVAGKHRYD